jgi:hypothetical protein
MYRIKIIQLVWIAIWAALSVSVAMADEFDAQYYDAALSELELLGEAGEKPGEFPESMWRYRGARAVLDGPGEAYVTGGYMPWRRTTGGQGEVRVVARAPQGKEVTGTIFLSHENNADSFRKFRFKMPAKNGGVQFKQEFYRHKAYYYESLLARDLPGAGWIRHQAREAGRQGGLEEISERQNDRRRFGNIMTSDLSGTFSIVSGGRAISENLQLDRVLPRSKPDQPASIDLASIEGITVREYDWSQYISKEEEIETDLLANFIPSDQHAVFFRSFSSMLDIFDHADIEGTPLLRAADPRSEDARTRERYQRQLCLPLGRLERLFGAELIGQVAITGSDTYFRTGTDVAVLFASSDPDALKTLLSARMALAKQTNAQAESVKGQLLGVEYQGVRTPDRSICAYLVNHLGIVIVSNSTIQLERVLSVMLGQSPALGNLSEYRYFRKRYPLNNQQESALVMISDAAIRRWCGPQWRIAASRRVRAAAIMSEIQAVEMERIVSQNAEVRKVPADWWVPGAEEFTVNHQGVASSIYGTLEFQTPISELDISRVTEEERDFYVRWRNGYQSNWSNYFDPIAVSLEASDRRLALDMTVMPLIDFSSYREMIAVSRGATIDAKAIDLHPEALAHFGLALNPESETLKRQFGILKSFAPQLKVDPFSWLGRGFAVYVDEDPFWQEMSEAEDAEKFLQANFARVPIAVHFDVKNGLKLTAFLVGLRAFVEQTVPGMVTWEALSYRDRGYVKIAPAAAIAQNSEELKEAALYYVASASAWVITPSEAVLKRAIDRQIDGLPEKDQTELIKNVTVGENVNFVLNMAAAQMAARVWGLQYNSAMQQSAWGNIPVLNEWRRIYPDKDPIAVHQQVWKTKLVCPGGGTYQWNEEWQTMESTVYGHPSEPKTGPMIPPTLTRFTRALLGATFEKEGLRTHVELNRTP